MAGFGRVGEDDAEIQIGGFFFLVWQFSNIGPYTYAIMIILSVLVLVVVFEKDDLNPSYKVMWIIITVILPITGAVMYLLWGDRRLSPKTARIFSQIEQKSAQAIVPQPALFDVLERADTTLSRQAEYLYRNAAAALYCDTDCHYFSSGEAFFECFLTELEKAQRCIFMEYFIVAEGLMFETILKLLKQKVKEGIEVRFIYDDVGSLTTVPYHFEKQLEEYGIQCVVFNPFVPIV